LSIQTSDAISAIRRIESSSKEFEDFEKKSKKGFADKEDQARALHVVEQKTKEAEEGRKTLEKLQNQAKNSSMDGALQKVLSTVIPAQLSGNSTPPPIPEPDSKPVFRSNNLSNLNKEQRKLLSRVYGVINRTLDAERAELVIQKIEAEFKR
jgi:molecular chaperone HtpG